MTAFFRPDSLAQALSLLGEYKENAAVVNGGSDIVPEISKGQLRPEAIVYIGGVAELRGIAAEDGFLCIGGTVTYDDILEHPACREFRGLIQAVSQVGSPAIRAVGTPAGNLGTAAPAPDCATMLLALGAQAELRSSEGSRTVALDDFYLGRGKTVRTPEELITAIRVPALREGEGTGYFRVSRRKAQDIGKILAGSRVLLKDGRVAEARISLGAVNACITRAGSLEAAVLGKTAAEAIGYLKRTFPAEAGLRESYFKEYKEQVTSSAVARSFALALEDAAERSGLWRS